MKMSCRRHLATIAVVACALFGPAAASDAAAADAAQVHAAPAPAASAPPADLVPPRVVRHVSATLPRSSGFARRHEDEIRMIVAVDVGIDGKPDNVEVVDTNMGTAHRRAALQAVAFWRFEPATRNGVAVATTVLVPVRFAVASGRAPGERTEGVRAPPPVWLPAPQRN